MDTRIATTHRLNVRFLSVILSIFALVLFVLSGCASSPISSSADEFVPQEGEKAAPADAAYDMPLRNTAEQAKKAGTTGEMGSSRRVSSPAQMIVRSKARVKVDNPKESYDSFEAEVIRIGGVVDSSTLELDDSSPYIFATVRIPAPKFNGFLASLDSYGTVTERSTHSENVGIEVADIDGRIKALETSIERLTKLMSEASTTSDLLEAETQLTYRQSELDSLRSQQRWYADQIAMSTLEISFTSSVSFNAESHSVWQQSWQAFVNGLTLILIILVWMLPWGILAAIIAAPIIMWRRRRRARLRRAAEGKTSYEQLGTGSVPLAQEITEEEAHRGGSE